MKHSNSINNAEWEVSLITDKLSWIHSMTKLYLGAVYGALGDITEAENMHSSCLEKCTTILGSDNECIVDVAPMLTKLDMMFLSIYV